jgi:hypothetical protein
MPRRWTLALAAVVSLLAARWASAQPLDRAAVPDPAALGVGSKAPDLAVEPLDGPATTLSRLLEGRRALVIAFTSAECPMSRRYGPRLARVMRDVAPLGVASILVNVVDAETPTQARAFAREFGIDAPCVMDTRGVWRRAFLPRTTTEVFVLTAERRIAFRGAVDDQYRLGGAAPRPSAHYLRDALDAVLAGRDPSPASTTAPGCLVDPPAEPAEVGEVTYYPRVHSILVSRCTPCHALGGAGPFAFPSAAALQGRASMLASVVRENLMPPGHGVTGPLVAEAGLAPDERRDLLAWLTSGRAVGDPGESRPPAPEATWSIGRPEALVMTPEWVLPADGPLLHRRFVVPVPGGEARWVGAAECRPTMRDGIELGLVWAFPPGAPLPEDGRPPASGVLLAMFSPATGAARWQGDHAPFLAAGSALVIDLYARPMGRAANNQLRVALRWRDPASMAVRTLAVVTEGFTVPPGDPAFHTGTNFTIARPMRLVAVTPIMRWRGRELRLSAQAPGQPERVLLHAASYDPRWLLRYPLSAPVDLPAGTRLGLTGRFDNSAANHSNPDPAFPAAEGAGPFDESLQAWLEWCEPSEP